MNATFQKILPYSCPSCYDFSLRPLGLLRSCVHLALHRKTTCVTWVEPPQHVSGNGSFLGPPLVKEAKIDSFTRGELRKLAMP